MSSQKIARGGKASKLFKRNKNFFLTASLLKYWNPMSDRVVSRGQVTDTSFPRTLSKRWVCVPGLNFETKSPVSSSPFDKMIDFGFFLRSRLSFRRLLLENKAAVIICAGIVFFSFFLGRTRSDLDRGRGRFILFFCLGMMA